jgi:rhodanese-related sulfurtransferase
MTHSWSSQHPLRKDRPREVRPPRASFDAQISTLDTAGSYLIYCRSGNRSAQAAERMKALGLSVIDGGGLLDMENAGWEFVR